MGFCGAEVGGREVVVGMGVELFVLSASVFVLFSEH